MFDKPLIFLMIWLLSLAGPAFAQEYPLSPLKILTSQGPLEFEVELPETKAELAKGLMFRHHMPPQRGMLFLFKGRPQVSMWMKNTYVSLDMLFIDPQGTIVFIAKNTQPLSLESITAPQGLKIAAVLELKAGTVEAKDIALGDQIKHPALSAGE